MTPENIFYVIWIFCVMYNFDKTASETKEDTGLHSFIFIVLMIFSIIIGYLFDASFFRLWLLGVLVSAAAKETSRIFTSIIRSFHPPAGQ